MSSFSVVVHFDEFEYLSSGVFQAQKAPPLQQLGLEAREERFGKGVIVRVIGSRHTLEAVVLFEQFPESVSHVLTAPVGVDDQAGCGFRHSKPFLRAPLMRSSSIVPSTCQPTSTLEYGPDADIVCWSSPSK